MKQIFIEERDNLVCNAGKIRNDKVPGEPTTPSCRENVLLLNNVIVATLW